MKLICIITLIAVLLWYRDIKENLTQLWRDFWISLARILAFIIRNTRWLWKRNRRH